MTKQEFIKTMLVYHKTITANTPEDQINMLSMIWEHDLEKYSLDQLKDAWTEYRKKNEFLSLAKLTDILDAEEEVEYDYEAMFYWQKFLVELRHRTPENIRFDDPLTAYIADSVLPIKALKLTCMEKDEPYIQNRFIKEYKTLRSKKNIYNHIEAKGTAFMTGTAKRLLAAKASKSNLLEAGA